MRDPVQTDLWKEEVTQPSQALEAALIDRAAKKEALAAFGDSDKEAKDLIRELARDMEVPDSTGQLVVHVNDVRYACNIKAHTRVSIKQLSEDD